MKRQRGSFGLFSLAMAASVVFVGSLADAQVLETFDDSCSVDVVVKVPYSNASSLDDGDIVLARSAALCQVVEGPTGNHPGVCQKNAQATTPFTSPIPYSSIRNSDRRFRWFCGTTAERSRCKSGTRRVQFQLGPSGLLRTNCLR